MYYVLVLTLAVGACAAVPDYLTAYINSYDASKLLLKRLSNEDLAPSPEQISYAVLKNAISGIADLELLTDLTYDKVYVLGALLTQAVAKSAPLLVLELAKQRNALAKQKTEQLRKIIEDNCHIQPTLLSKPADCNQEVHELVLNSSVLLDEAQLLLALGDLGDLYLNLDDDLAAVSKDLQDSEYLAGAGKEKLREVVAQTLKTYKLLYVF